MTQSENDKTESKTLILDDYKAELKEAQDGAFNLSKLYAVQLELMDYAISDARTYGDVIAALERAKEMADKKPDKLNSVLIPKDKPTKKAFSSLSAEQNEAFIVTANEYDKGLDDIGIYVRVDFSNVPAGRLSAYDRRVYRAIVTLWLNGERLVSLPRINELCGGTERMSKNQRDKLLDSIRRMMTTKVFVDNTAEAARYTKYDHIVTETMLLRCEIRHGVILASRTVDHAILLDDKPPALLRSTQRGAADQLATVPLALLSNKEMSLTEDRVSVVDYVLERIADMKSGALDANTILLKTLYDECNLTEKKQRQRAKGDTLPRILDKCKKDKYINGYTIDAERVTIQLKKPGKEKDHDKRRKKQ